MKAKKPRTQNRNLWSINNDWSTHLRLLSRIKEAFEDAFVTEFFNFFLMYNVAFKQKCNSHEAFLPGPALAEKSKKSFVLESSFIAHKLRFCARGFLALIEKTFL